MYLRPGYYNTYSTTRQDFSYMRLLNASPGMAAVDVYANSSLIASGLSYKGFTEYMQVIPGFYNIKIFQAGTTGTAIVDMQIEIPVKSVVTAAIIGIPPAAAVKAFFEPVLQIPQGKLYLRFANLSPDSASMDFVLSDGTALFEDISYGAVASYVAVLPNVYTFYLQRSGTDTSLLYVPNIRLLPDRFYTIYAVGTVTGDIPLQVLVPLDGNSYIRP